MYTVKTKVEVIDSNRVLLADEFGGWDCINEGTTVAIVNNVRLDPSGTLAGRSFTDLHPEVLWDEPITVKFEGAGVNRLVVTRLKYTKK